MNASRATRRPRAVRACRSLALAAAVLLSPTARAQDVLGAGEAGEARKPAHAWLILKQEADGDCAVVHLPPREAVMEDGRVHGAPSGTVRVAARIRTTPEHIAALDADVYLLFPPISGAPGREVWSLSARAAGIGDLWRYEPDGSLTPHPSLPIQFEPEAFFGAVGRLFVLTRDKENHPGMKVLHEDQWTDITLPEDVAAAVRLGYRTIDAWDLPGGFALGIGKGDQTLSWKVTISGPPHSIPTLAWSAMPSGAAFGRERGGQFAVGATPVRWNRTDTAIHLESVVGAQVVSLADIAGVSEDAAVVPAGPGRVIVAWSEPIPPDPRVREPKQRYKLSLAEVSPDTGQVLYLGPPKGASPISADQFRFLVLGMVALMAAVLMFVLRSSGRDQEVHLDRDMALSDPGRRMVAFSADILVGLIVSSRILGVDLAEVMEPETLLLAGGPLVLLTLASGFVIGTLTEWLFGRSFGKFLTGIEVVGLISRPGSGSATARPKLWQVLVRNAIKWGLPPVSGIALIDPSGRHQGERLTRTAVVIRFEPQGEEL